MANGFDPVGAFQGARRNALAIQAAEQDIARERAQAPVRNELAQLQLGQAKTGAQQQQTQFDQQQAIQRATVLNKTARALKGINPAQRAAAFQSLEPRLEQFGIPAGSFNPADAADDAKLDQVIAETQGFITDPGRLTSTLQNRQALIAAIQPALDDEGNFDPDKADASATSAAMELGLISKAGTLTSSERVARDEKLTEDVASSQALIEGAKTKAKEDVKTSTKKIEESFETVGKIESNIRNLDRAIRALEGGAQTGAIAKFVPNITAASRELRQVQNELGLDIIGSVTFGALSQGELDLALETALDLGQSEDALLAQLREKKEAQRKLINYLDEQMQFLDDGGTVAEWRAFKKGQTERATTQQPEQTGIRFLGFE